MDLKERANALFKKRAFKEDAGLYAQVPDEPTFPSNLSAALFELGDYAGCFEAITRAFKIISGNTGGNETLALRLSTRMAKALSNGVASGCLTLASVDERKDIVDGLRARLDKMSMDGGFSEARRVWDDWDRVRGEWAKLGEKERRQAQIDVSRLSVTKKPIDPVLEYYLMGHDPIISIVDDWGPDDEPSPINLDQIPFDHLPNLAFLFGGVGDGALVMSTGLSLVSTAHTRRSQLKAHFTLLDIHPTMIARGLVVFMLMDLLVQGKESHANELEIKAAIFYTFVGVVIPKVYNKWVTTVVKQLRSMLSQTARRLPSWLYASDEAASKILDVIKQWDPFPAEKTAQNIVTHYRYSPSPMEYFTDVRDESNFEYQSESRRAQIFSILTDYSTHLRETQNQDPKQSNPPLTRAQATEELWHRVTTTFVPPKELRKGLPKTSVLLDFMKSTGRRVRGTRTVDVIFEEALVEINANYSANTTFYDPISCNNRVMAFDGWANLYGVEVLEPLPIVQEFNSRFRLPPNAVCRDDPDAAAFGTFATFFDAVVSSWKGLRDKVTFEVVLGELNQELAKMRSPASGRPASFPTEFTRMWLSNVPDYTHGLMNQVIYGFSSLQMHRYAGVASNCLLHTMSFIDDPDEYCHTYTLLSPGEMPRFLNCRIDRLHPVLIELVGWNTEQRKLKELPSRDDVTRWLTRVLLNILYPGDLSIPQQYYNRGGVRHTSSLNAYVALILHLPTLGYPAHWLAEFVQTLLSNELVTDVDIFVGPLPIPTSYSLRRVPSRKTWLDPWLPELRALFSLAYATVPFPLLLVSSQDEIGLYEASPLITPAVQFQLYQEAHTHAPSTSLMFFNPHACQKSPTELVRNTNIRGILDGTGYHPPKDKIAIFTAPEIVDVNVSVVRWRMIARDYERMKTEDWVLVLYRYDNDTIVGRPMVASSWKRVGDIRVAAA